MVATVLVAGLVAAVPASGALDPGEARPALRHDTSAPLREMAAGGAPGDSQVRPARGRGGPNTPSTGYGRPGNGVDPVVQQRVLDPAMPAPVESFEGLSNDDNVPSAGDPIPPDTVGDVGPDHYVQMVNVSMAVFDKDSGMILLGPIPSNQIWEGMPGTSLCETTNRGDPIVLYDPLADRWLVSQFAFGTDDAGHPIGPYSECVAVSVTGDPTGAWHRYEFQTSATLLPDYPKLGVWPDAYYMGINEFDSDDQFVRATLVALEREAMLDGADADMIIEPILPSNPDLEFFTPMPADLDGVSPPPPGSPGYFIEVEGEEFDWPNDRLHLFEMAVEWDGTPSATVTGPITLTVSTANINMCAGVRDCIPQPGVSQNQYLDALDERLMFRAAYRNFGDHESLMVNHTVDVVTGSGRRAGIRWYEIRGLSGTPTIFQEGSYAPNDGVNRWMGSIAMDRDGNVAVGYSVSSSTVNPGIRYAGRLASDPLGQLAQGETTLFAGGGSQLDQASRWGDYSAMSVDPEDDCTFWYTNEYYPSDSARGWHTRIGSFRFPSCSDDETPSCPGYEDDSRNQVVGTAGGDDLTGTAGSDVICGLGGNDDLSGLGGDDLVLGGDGADSGIGGGGSDTVKGGLGGDDLTGGIGADRLEGKGGADDLAGGDGADTVLGGLGADVLLGGLGNDVLNGGDGPDILHGQGGDDSLNGGSGTDTCTQGPGTGSSTSCEAS